MIRYISKIFTTYGNGQVKYIGREQIPNIVKIKINYFDSRKDLEVWCEENCKFIWGVWEEFSDESLDKNSNEIEKFIGFESLEENMIFMLSNNI